SNSLTNLYALNGGSFARHSGSNASLRSQYRRTARAPNGNKSVTSGDVNSLKSDSVTVETLVASHEKSESEDTTARSSTTATTPTRQQMVTFLDDSKTDIRK
ncbi:2640_t:CDS:2, partial [Paraglomus occultum]